MYIVGGKKPENQNSIPDLIEILETARKVLHAWKSNCCANSYRQTAAKKQSLEREDSRHGGPKKEPTENNYVRLENVTNERKVLQKTT